MRLRCAMSRPSLVHLLALLAALGGGCGGNQPIEGHTEPAPTGIRFLASGDAAGFARAESPRPFQFPADHGAHRAFRSEWWYFTGNLLADDQRHFGFELTFFRYALAPPGPPRQSRWATSEIWMAHLAVTDAAEARFATDERLSRESLGLAGASETALDVWVRDWSARQSAPAMPIVLSAQGVDAGLELHLEPATETVAQGDGGLDRKGPEPGNASYYYSIPRLRAHGRLRVGNQAPIDVAGLAWLDREWGTSALSPGVEGWDWFGLQLSDGRDIMFYRLRNVDGTATEFSSGTIVAADGSAVRLGADDVRLEPRTYWTSPTSKVRYPIGWRMLIPGVALELDVAPLLPNQEIDLSLRYWEGAVAVSGARAGAPITGSGYLELAGYR